MESLDILEIRFKVINPYMNVKQIFLKKVLSFNNLK